MNQQDYYSILGIRTSATQTDIRKAFRKLALINHPDKNHASAMSEEKFRQIHEAYQVLADSRKRAIYDYERKLNYQHPAKQIRPASAVELLDSLQKMYQQIQLQDPFRLDKDILFYQLIQLLSEENLQLLEPNNSKAFAKESINLIHICSVNFTKNQINEAVNLLNHFTKKGMLSNQDLSQLQVSLLQVYFWNKYKVLFAFFITLFLCLLMFILTQKK